MRKPWQPDEIALLKREYPDTLTADIARRLGRKVHQVHSKAASLGLRKSQAFHASPMSGRLRPGDMRGMGSRFRKGITPHNKGKKGWDAGGRSVETRYRKGNISGKAAMLLQPLGTERVTRDGIRQRKVRMDGPPQRRWKSVHSILWEDHNGPIPKGHIVVFRNGDRTDIRIDNLELITRAENMRRNTIHKLPEELADLCRLKGRLTRRIHNLESTSSEEQD